MFALKILQTRCYKKKNFLGTTIKSSVMKKKKAKRRRLLAFFFTRPFN